MVFWKLIYQHLLHLDLSQSQRFHHLLFPQESLILEDFLSRNKEKKVVDLIIDNKCQLMVYKDNVINKDDCLKIFPKIKEFNALKKDLDKNCFFSSSYYERVLK